MNSSWKNSSRERYKFTLIKWVAKWQKTWSCFTEVGGELPRTSLLLLLPAHPGYRPPPAWADRGCEDFCGDGAGFAGWASFCCSCWGQVIMCPWETRWVGRGTAPWQCCAVSFVLVLLKEQVHMHTHTYILFIYIRVSLATNLWAKAPADCVCCHWPVPIDEDWDSQVSVGITTHLQFWLHQQKPPLTVLVQALLRPWDGTTGRSHAKGSAPRPSTRPAAVPSPGGGRGRRDSRLFHYLPTSLLPFSACSAHMTWNLGQPCSVVPDCCHWDHSSKPCVMSADKGKPFYFGASEGARWIAELWQPNGFWRGGSGTGHGNNLLGGVWGNVVAAMRRGRWSNNGSGLHCAAPALWSAAKINPGERNLKITRIVWQERYPTAYPAPSTLPLSQEWNIGAIVVKWDLKIEGKIDAFFFSSKGTLIVSKLCYF